MEKIKVFAPATVANVACGFDIMGFALEGVGDVITVEKTGNGKLEIGEILGANGIPTDPEKNVSTVSVKAMLDRLGKQEGFKISIEKKVKPGSGLGSSASSSAGAVVAVNELLGNPFSRKELVEFAMEGEKAASEKPHADNVAPSILGGFTVIKGYDPLDVFTIDYPEDLYATVIFPEVEVKTADAKKILKSQINLSDAITQWGNVAGLTAGLITKDYDLIARSLKDVIVEPVRSMLIPCYDQVKEAALEAGALGCNISGSGPSIFALSKGKETAEKVGTAMGEVFKSIDIDFDKYISTINAKGTEIIS